MEVNKEELQRRVAERCCLNVAPVFGHELVDFTSTAYSIYSNCAAVCSVFGKIAEIDSTCHFNQGGFPVNTSESSVLLLESLAPVLVKLQLYLVGGGGGFGGEGRGLGGWVIYLPPVGFPLITQKRLNQ